MLRTLADGVAMSAQVLISHGVWFGMNSRSCLGCAVVTGSAQNGLHEEQSVAGQLTTRKNCRSVHGHMLYCLRSVCCTCMLYPIRFKACCQLRVSQSETKPQWVGLHYDDLSWR